MARGDERFRAAFNRLLDVCSALEPGQSLPSEAALAERIEASRTLVRTALRDLDARGLVHWKGRSKALLRAPRASDRMPVRAEGPTRDELEARFFDWILRFDVPADTVLNVSQLARRFDVTPALLGEVLSGLSRFGLVERRPRGGWILRGFTVDYALELSDMRRMVELEAVRRVLDLSDDHPVWGRLEALRYEHEDLLDRIETDFHDFSKLDERFHGALLEAVPNRFVAEFRKVVSLIFHYHYQWNKADERDRNEAAIHEHLLVLSRLERRDPGAVAAAEGHLATAKQTLLASLRQRASA